MTVLFQCDFCQGIKPAIMATDRGAHLPYGWATNGLIDLCAEHIHHYDLVMSRRPNTTPAPPQPPTPPKLEVVP